MKRPLRVVLVRLVLALLAASALGVACWLGGQPTRNAEAGENYSCPMHPQVHTVTPGDCSICGMALERHAPAAGGRRALAPSAARFVSYGRGPVQRRVLRLPLDAPAWVDDEGVIGALLYEDEVRALAAGAAAFDAASGSRLAVRALAEPAARWDQVRWQVKFRAEDTASRLAAGSVGRVRAELAPREVLAVLSSAVIPTPEGPAVLVVAPDQQSFTRRRIEIGRTSSGYTSVLSGVLDDELVVLMNAFFLDAEQRLQGTEPTGTVPVR